MLTKEKVKQIQKVASKKTNYNTQENFFGMLWRLESLINNYKQNSLQWIDFYLHPCQKQLVKNAYNKANLIQTKSYEIAGIKIRFTSEVLPNVGLMINHNIRLSNKSAITVLL